MVRSRCEGSILAAFDISRASGCLLAQVMPAVRFCFEYAYGLLRNADLRKDCIRRTLGNQNQNLTSTCAAPYAADKIDNHLLAIVVTKVNERSHVPSRLNLTVV